MILDEINYFKKLYNEKLLKKKKMLRQWRQYKMMATNESEKIEIEEEVKKKVDTFWDEKDSTRLIFI